jgi:hypothetical protein
MSFGHRMSRVHWIVAGVEDDFDEGGALDMSEAV